MRLVSFLRPPGPFARRRHLEPRLGLIVRRAGAAGPRREDPGWVVGAAAEPWRMKCPRPCEWEGAGPGSPTPRAGFGCCPSAPPPAPGAGSGVPAQAPLGRRVPCGPARGPGSSFPGQGGAAWPHPPPHSCFGSVQPYPLPSAGGALPCTLPCTERGRRPGRASCCCRALHGGLACLCAGHCKEA